MSLIAAVGKRLFWITSMSIPISQGETKPIIFVENPIHKIMAAWPGFFWHESSTDVWSTRNICSSMTNNQKWISTGSTYRQYVGKEKERITAKQRKRKELTDEETPTKTCFHGYKGQKWEKWTRSNHSEVGKRKIRQASDFSMVTFHPGRENNAKENLQERKYHFSFISGKTVVQVKQNKQTKKDK